MLNDALIKRQRITEESGQAADEAKKYEISQSI